MAGNNVSDFLQSKARTVDNIDVAQIWAQLDDLHSKKLWHQLTETLKAFVIHHWFKNGGLVELYHKFITDFEHKINPLSLVEISLVVVKEISNVDEALFFIESIKEKVKNDLESKVLCMVSIGNMKLLAHQLEDVKLIMEEAGTLLDTTDGVTSVHARYYDLCSEYNKVIGDHAEYYRNALKFLGCVDSKLMSLEEKSNRSFCIAIAALVGEGIYNFGELLCQGVLEGLKLSENAWLIEMLQAFNEGDLAKFDRLKPLWSQQADLVANQDKLESKIRLLCLMELVFRRHAHERTIDFITIAETAKVDIKEVEFLVMKALSLGLLKGTIDEVDQQVNMTWVQPRVLDYTQVATVKDRVSEWCSQIKVIRQMMEEAAPEIVTHS